MANEYSEITPEIQRLADLCQRNGRIDPELYTRYDVKRGLRDLNGKGVLAGLTEISEIQSTMKVDGKDVPCEGKLFYRGIDVEELIRGCVREQRFGFEETTYLLLFGELPTREELDEFNRLLSHYRSLPTSFVRDIIMKAPSHDMMNTLARSVLTLYSYDDFSDDISIPNVLRQCMQLIALFPLLSVYGYQAYRHYHDGQSLFIHSPVDKLSTAENILHILRADCKYTALEARVLDIALILHAEHGGGNNSTFTTHVVSSSGTDTYSAIAAALGSLKGPKHGGANIKVVRMFEDMKEVVKDWKDEEEVSSYLRRLLHKEAFDKAGLIYGMGHAVYSLSDPRAKVMESFVKSLSEEKRAHGRIQPLFHGGPAGSPDYQPGAPDLQGRQPQRGLLQRVYLQHAGSAPGAVYADLRHCAYFGLERPPHRGTHQCREDYPSGLPRRPGPAGLPPHGPAGINTRKRGRPGCWNGPFLQSQAALAEEKVFVEMALEMAGFFLTLPGKQRTIKLHPFVQKSRKVRDGNGPACRKTGVLSVEEIPFAGCSKE